MKKVYCALFVLVSFAPFNAFTMAQKNKVFIHVQGDSNSEGVLPGPLMEWNNDVCAGKTYANPWPTVLEEELSKMGREMIVLNHGEGGRRLTGKSSFKNALNGVGIKDGRVSLQQIVMLMMNQGGERNEKNILLINLGTNDLDAADITEEHLYNKVLTHVVTILTNPTLQLNLLSSYEQTKQAPLIDFMKRLNVLISDEISRGATDENLVKFVGHNKDIIQKREAFSKMAFNC